MAQVIVTYKNKKYSVPKGMLLWDCFKKEFQENNLPLGVRIANRTKGLYQHIHANIEVQALWFDDDEGKSIYSRSAALMLGYVLHTIFPTLKVEICQSIQGNSYYQIKNKDQIPNNFFDLIQKKMEELSLQENIFFNQTSLSIEGAVSYFEKTGYPQKVLLIKTLHEPYVRLNTLHDYWDYQIGPVAFHTHQIQEFKIEPYENGFLLRLPSRTTHSIEPLREEKKFHEMYMDSLEYHSDMKIHTIGELNEMVLKNNFMPFIHMSEAFQEKRIANIADQILSQYPETKIVLISGPSSSGKTTFSHRLGIQLSAIGLNPIKLSLDNYFLNRENTPIDENGEVDFECLEAIDLERLNEDLNKLLQSKKVKIPIFNFHTGKRDETKSFEVQLQKKDVLVIEGIHGLNPKLVPNLPTKSLFKIYVSAITQIVIDETNRLRTTDTRLYRRIIRDNLFRGHSTSFTLNIWPKVRAGEKKYIFPYHEFADAMFNSAIIYEHSVMKMYLQRYLLTVEPQDKSCMEAYRLYRNLSYFIPIFPEIVPKNSILREFIGGSSFHYL